jgi:poly(3-hydroxyalkanoate) synthetase
MSPVQQQTGIKNIAFYEDWTSIVENTMKASMASLSGIAKYSNEFALPYAIASGYFRKAEENRMSKETVSDTVGAYLGMMNLNQDLIYRGVNGASSMIFDYIQKEMTVLQDAILQSFMELKFEKLKIFIKRQAVLADMVNRVYPQAIKAIEPEYGFHFERGEHMLMDETDRFLLYRVSPSIKKVELRLDAKPVLIIPPYVLGANILGFLPGEQRSYAHSFADHGFPTYIRVLKNIETTPPLQLMTGEDDAKDTRRFCEKIKKAHGKRVTLNGYCQGGFSCLCNLLSGQLDDLVDAFITCVSPIDGTRSRDLAKFLGNLPDRFNNLMYGTKMLPNGNEVADGSLMGWVYKLKSINNEIPIAVFIRDLLMFANMKDGDIKISKTAAALNYWLQNERFDLPLEITRMSFLSYNEPITSDGTLPIRLFGNPLNLKRLKEKNIPWLICYGKNDDLVEKETALAALDYIDAEVSEFPKGHVAIATSWSSPKSACALHTRFGEKKYRGPVRFHMDMDEALQKKEKGAKANEALKAAAVKKKTNKPAAQKRTIPKSGKAAPKRKEK